MRRSKEELQPIHDLLEHQQLSLPMSGTQYERWRELIALDEGMSGNRAVSILPRANDYTAMRDYAQRFGVRISTLARTFCHIGIRALQAAELDDQHIKATYYMQQALQYAQYLSPNDRRYAREHLLDVRGTMSAEVKGEQE